ncbi:aminopeptidase [Ancylobacter amanitiformis]|uniref:Aminopeptidase n=1 Tax=Ancylobacter amanitiformis TaxID=217069 RepID=A0ABU0LPW8_9HYPH|nr:aminopeptidase [Ancylobacter amanitiformis]MDQ0510755.1 aminopeptidase [Ancylobacter amanitiformis]
MPKHASVSPHGFSHEEQLDRLGQVAVHVGLGLRPGQELVMTASIDALPLVRRITEHAYKAGASLVTTLFSDEEAALARFRHAPDQSFDVASGWLYEGMAGAFRNGAARLAISGENPSLLANEDPEKVSRANRARSKAYMPALSLIAGFDINWTIVSYASPAWAKAMFPEDPEDIAVAKLWHAIFAASRVDTPDPVAAWAAHNDQLHARTTRLNAKRYAALRFRGPGTDLTVGLADEHEWAGGASTAKNGIVCNANIPTEEVFTTPHKGRVDGFVASTKPLSYQGTLIQDIAVRFEGGRIVEANARTGADVLGKVLETDEGSRRLGEVALVPHSSPISKSGLLFYNTLYDENASSHIALGQSYSKCFINGSSLSPEELAARGANSSLIHIDWMIGSGEVDVDGITASGEAEPVMRRGEWA